MATHKPTNVVPRHVAVIMDGNGRWAAARSLPRHAGHRAGLKSVRAAIETCAKAGVEVLTLFAFSSENWKRPRDEVSLLMSLFLEALDREISDLHKNGIKVRFIGDLTQLSTALQGRMRDAELLTRGNSRLTVLIAMAYGGRWDITQAAQSLARQCAAGTLAPEQIDEERLAGELALDGLPDPDLFIRTGGDQRISNFLLWNLAYTELYFCDALWPDFGDAELRLALEQFASRERRFGLTSEQRARATE
ncbi:MAG: polyprenyl diphosphate synthase [Steroidobacteraceae bacterium]